MASGSCHSAGPPKEPLGAIRSDLQRITWCLHMARGCEYTDTFCKQPLEDQCDSWLWQVCWRRIFRFCNSAPQPHKIHHILFWEFIGCSVDRSTFSLWDRNLSWVLATLGPYQTTTFQLQWYSGLATAQPWALARWLAKGSIELAMRGGTRHQNKFSRLDKVWFQHWRHFAISRFFAPHSEI